MRGCQSRKLAERRVKEGYLWARRTASSSCCEASDRRSYNVMGHNKPRNAEAWTGRLDDRLALVKGHMWCVHAACGLRSGWTISDPPRNATDHSFVSSHGNCSLAQGRFADETIPLRMPWRRACGWQLAACGSRHRDSLLACLLKRQWSFTLAARPAVVFSLR